MFGLFVHPPKIARKGLRFKLGLTQLGHRGLFGGNFSFPVCRSECQDIFRIEIFSVSSILFGKGPVRQPLSSFFLPIRQEISF